MTPSIFFFFFLNTFVSKLDPSALVALCLQLRLQFPTLPVSHRQGYVHPFYFFQGHLCRCFLSSWKVERLSAPPTPSSRGSITASIQGKGKKEKIKALARVSSWLPPQPGGL